MGAGHCSVLYEYWMSLTYNLDEKYDREIGICSYMDVHVLLNGSGTI